MGMIYNNKLVINNGEIGSSSIVTGENLEYLLPQRHHCPARMECGIGGTRLFQLCLPGIQCLSLLPHTRFHRLRSDRAPLPHDVDQIQLY